MHQVLEQAERDLAIELPHLRDAAGRTAQRIDDARDAIRDYLHEHLEDAATSDLGLDIVAFGSMARQEMGAASDFDFLVVAHKLGTDPRTIQHLRAAAQAGQHAVNARDPGTTGLFGVMVGAADMVNVIGLNEDTNKTLTRRILILQESIPLNEYNRHERLVRGIINRYLVDYQPGDPPLVPRFLVNDVLRYWRTVAVDYQAKRWEEMRGEKWGLRYIKLRSTRKLAFAGTLMSLFMPVIIGGSQRNRAPFLHRQFELPPLARLAQLSPYVRSGSDTHQALTEVLTLADQFVGWLADKKFRSIVSDVTDPRHAPHPPEFELARQSTAALQLSLERLFFSNDPLEGTSLAGSLGTLSRKYLSF